jgi:hypothetical protein
MEKKYVGIVLASVFVLSLIVLGSLNVDSVVATTSTTSTSSEPEPECEDDDDCDPDEWCSGREVRMEEICNEDGECVDDPIEYCGQLGQVCEEFGSNPQYTICTNDIECEYSYECVLKYGADFCSGDLLMENYCISLTGQCSTRVDSNCTESNEVCVVKGGSTIADSCEECDSNDDCAYWKGECSADLGTAMNGWCNEDENVCEMSSTDCEAIDKWCRHNLFTYTASCEYAPYLWDCWYEPNLVVRWDLGYKVNGTCEGREDVGTTIKPLYDITMTSGTAEGWKYYYYNPDGNPNGIGAMGCKCAPWFWWL